MESREQLEQAVRFARYPLEGVRGIGGRARNRVGASTRRARGRGERQRLRRADHRDGEGRREPAHDVRRRRASICSGSARRITPRRPVYRGQWEGPGVAERSSRMKDDAPQCREALRRAWRRATTTCNSDWSRASARSAWAWTRGCCCARCARRWPQSGVIARCGRTWRAVGRESPEHAAALGGLTPPARRGSTKPFRVAFTGDFHDPEGTVKYRDIGLDALVDTNIEVEFFARHLPEIATYQLAGPNGVIVLTPRVTADEPRDVSRSARDRALRRRLRHGRCRGLHRGRRAALHRGRGGGSPGRGGDGRLDARADAPRATRKTGSFAKSKWDDRSQYMGTELRDRTLGVIGFGGIGRALVKLLAGFGMKPPLVYDPFVKPADATRARRDARLARSTALRVRFRVDPLPAQRPDARPDRRARTRHDEADRVPHQHGPRRHRGRRGARRGACANARSPARRSTASRTNR